MAEDQQVGTFILSCIDTCVWQCDSAAKRNLELKFLSCFFHSNEAHTVVCLCTYATKTRGCFGADSPFFQAVRQNFTIYGIDFKTGVNINSILAFPA